MPILALGVSYRRAPVALLGALAFGEDDLPKAYRRAADLDSVEEAVILSTCNRVEVYAEVPGYHAGFQDLKTLLADSSGLDPSEFADPLYARYEDDAVEHLFGVAAGIDSMVTGEPQILDQVREALKRAEAEGGAGPTLGDLFRRGVRFGRRAREETGIGASPAAFVDAGAELAEGALGRLDGATVLVVGAGKMGALAVGSFRERGAETVLVANRTEERAGRLAERYGGRAHPLSDLPRLLAEADVVISSTGSTEEVIAVPDVEEAMASRADRPLFVMDLAVPRDVDPSAGEVAGVTLADIDSLRRVLGDREGDADVAAVRAMARAEVQRLAARRRAARLAPLIQSLLDRAERIRSAELARLGSRLAGLSPREREAVESLTKGIVAKLLHDPVVRVKDLAAQGDASAKALTELFGLDRGDDTG